MISLKFFFLMTVLSLTTQANVFQSVDQVIEAACGAIVKLDRVKDSSTYNQLGFTCEPGTTVDAQGCHASCRNEFAAAPCPEAQAKFKDSGCLVENGKPEKDCETIAQKKKCAKGMKSVYSCDGKQICVGPYKESLAAKKKGK